ncbi:hypothetical protein NUW54_g3408 [Trametes sanguinea]|uniref:Uncharacterized protein n=1 Tax=Trametes sanguinea TaxID=158606 RepID=A0ACC1Q304_9APHY|nr:hypothetical protein NUW54_g3408 [Trametes sanguinea]
MSMEDVSADRFAVAAASAPPEANPPELPAYARSITTEWDVPPAEQVHHFSLTSKKISSPQLSLTVMSRAKSATDRPTFYQCAPIIGSVELSLDKETLIDEVSVAPRRCGSAANALHDYTLRLWTESRRIAEEKARLKSAAAASTGNQRQAQAISQKKPDNASSKV